MPHSGGGGSHSGGGHHGGSHSSSHSSGGGGRSSIRTSRTPFAGCHTYAVYDRHGNSKIIYSDSSRYHEEMTLGECISSAIFGGVFFLPGAIELIAIIVILLSGFHIGVHKTPIPDSVDSTVYIYDTQDLVSTREENYLKESLEQFRDKTGIIPAVEFTTDDQWTYDYVDLEAFAYNEYVCNFWDENHLLIVYSFGPDSAHTDFQEFHWESMWGDDLSKTASTSDENYLTDTMQANLSRANGAGVANAIATSFDTFYSHLDRKGYRLSPDNIFTCLFLLVHGGVFAGVGGTLAFSTISKYLKGKGTKTYKIDGTPEILNCAYCGTSYYKGTIGNCINCGAPFSNQ